MLRTPFFRIASLVLTALVVALAGAAQASMTPVVLIYGTPPTSTLQSPGPAQAGPTKTITLNLNQNGNTAYGASLASLAIAGPQAADFAIVPGGTCVPGTTFLFPAGDTCTVKVNYRASTPASESATLTASCATVVGLTGGFILSCNSTVGTVAALVGQFVAAAAAVPAVSPGLLTVLAATLFALASYSALRRGNAPVRRR